MIYFRIGKFFICGDKIFTGIGTLFICWGTIFTSIAALLICGATIFTRIGTLFTHEGWILTGIGTLFTRERRHLLKEQIYFPIGVRCFPPAVIFTDRGTIITLTTMIFTHGRTIITLTTIFTYEGTIISCWGTIFSVSVTVLASERTIGMYRGGTMFTQEERWLSRWRKSVCTYGGLIGYHGAICAGGRVVTSEGMVFSWTVYNLLTKTFFLSRRFSTYGIMQFF